MRPALLALLVSAATLLGTTRPASAEEPQTRRYGHELLIADAAFAGVFYLAYTSEEGDDYTAAKIVSVLYLAPSLLHLRHGNRRGAALSAVTRAALPALGALVMSGAGCDADDGDPLTTCDGPPDFVWTAMGMAGGMTVASLIDYLGFARVEVVPAVDVTNGGASLSLAGSF